MPVQSYDANSAARFLAASSLYHSRSALGAFHRRLKARLGAPKAAITATAHKLACLIYRMLRFGSDYVQAVADALPASRVVTLVKVGLPATASDDAIIDKACMHRCIILTANGRDFVPKAVA